MIASSNTFYTRNVSHISGRGFNHKDVQRSNLRNAIEKYEI